MAKKNGGELKNTAKNSAIYAIGTMISRLTGLIMLPIYTRYLTPADYGVMELFTIAIELMGILVGVRITQAMFRYYILEDDPAEKKVIVSTVLLTVILASSVGTAILYSGAETFSQLLFGTDEYIFEFQLFSLTLLTNAMMAVGLAYIRARRKPILFVSIGVIMLALQVSFNILFVVYMDMHVTGVVYSAVISGALVSVVLVSYLLLRVGVHYSQKVANKLVAYVSPLILASLGAFFVAYADKYFIRIYGSLAEVGLYALALRISSILATIYQSFNMSWNADRYEIVKTDNAKIVFQQVFRFMAVIFIVIGVALSMFANDFFRIMTNPEFYSAGNVVPLLVAGMLVRMFARYCNFGIMLNEKTRYIAESSWIKAAVAVVVYVILIPPFGVFGAAVALLISNLVEFYWVNKHATRLYDMELQWKPILMISTICTAVVSVSLFMPVGDWQYFTFRLLMFISLLVVIYRMSLWTDEDKQMMRASVSKVVRKFKKS